MVSRNMLVYVALVLLVVALGSGVYVKTYLDRENRGTGNGVVRFTAGYDIYINGELVAHKENDPITKHFIYAVIDNLLLLNTGKEVEWMDYEGNIHTLLDLGSVDYGTVFKYIPLIYVVLGNGTGSASVDDYTVFSEVARIKVDDMTLDEGENEYVITYFLDWVSDKDFNLTEIALISLQYLYKSDTTTFLMIAHDNVNTIHVNVNDTVSIRYRIRLVYDPEGGLTRNFFYLVLRHFLGYAVYAKSVSGSDAALDNGHDTNSDNYDLVTDNITLALLKVSTWGNPVFTTYTYSDKYIADNYEITLSSNETSITLGYKFTVSETEAFTFNGIAITVYTDICDWKKGTYADQIIPDYIVLFVGKYQEIDVSSDQYVEAEISITFNFG